MVCRASAGLLAPAYRPPSDWMMMIDSVCATTSCMSRAMRARSASAAIWRSSSSFACKASLRSCIMLTVMRRARCQYATMIAANRYTAMKMNMATELVAMVVAQSPLRP
ncbi:Uncharacterised protein [Bifidobacterium bifidum]|nr:Uncharacterised protein [Bifidobacterium bifidum]